MKIIDSTFIKRTIIIMIYLRHVRVQIIYYCEFNTILLLQVLNLKLKILKCEIKNLKTIECLHSDQFAFFLFNILF